MALAFTLALAACGGGDDGDDGGETSSTPSNLSPTATPEVFGTVVQYESEGSGTVTAAYLTPEGLTGVPAVVLLHQEDGGREQWAEFAPTLAAAGYAVLAPSLDYSRDTATLSADVRASLEYLKTQPAVDASRRALIGSAKGANLAYLAAGTIPDLTTSITMSVDSRPDDPMLIGEGVSGFAPRSVQFIADEVESPESTTLANRTADPVQVKIMAGAAAHGGRRAHGVELLENELVTTGIMEWLAAQFAQGG
jgi:hypothetical protein